MTRPLAWGAVAVAALLLFLVLRSERNTGEDQAVIRSAEAALAQGKAYRQRLAILREAAQRAQGRATVAIAADRAKDAQVRRLQTVLSLDSTARDSVVTLTQMVDTLVAQRDSARSAVAALLFRVTADSTRASLAERRVDSLEAHLRAVLTVADCHILAASWLPRCPSRTTSSILGAATGAVAVLVLQH